VFVVNSNNATARQHARLAHQTQVANANAQAAQAKANTAQANAAAAQAKAQSDQANAAAAKANSQTAQANAAAAQANAAASANPNQSSTPATQPTNNGDPTAGLTWQEPNIWSTSGISNQLANNVFYRYWNGNSSSFSAWSEASKAWYPINCTSDSSYVYCNVGGTGDPDAEVLIAQQGLSAYTQAQADAYVASPNYQGP